MFSRAELVDIWSNNNRSGDAVHQHILSVIAEKHLDNETIKSINEKVKDFVNYLKKHLPKCNSTVERFKRKHANWLGKSLFIEITGHYALANKVGRPKCDYESAGPRLKRKLAAELSEENNNLSPLLIHAATVSAKKSNEKDLAVVLKAAASCESINEIKKKLFADEPKQMSADSALAFLMENGFTKRQYKTIPAEVTSLLQAPHLEIQCENDDPDSTQNSSDEEYDELDGLEVIASEDEYFELEEN